VLLREHGRRAEHGDLTPRERHAEGRAHRDFGLPEADVTAHDAIHRVLTFEVVQDLLDRPLLIDRLLEGEGGLELGVHPIGARERRALGRRALRVEAQELVGSSASRWAACSPSSCSAIRPGVICREQ
jgi:hypothetical protein